MATKKTTATKKASTAKKKSTPGAKVTAQSIQARAEEIYCERMNTSKHGDELSDWLQAEKDLKKS